MSDWNLETGTATKTSWTRSWRQEFYTDLGTDFRVVLHMERVTVLDTGEVIHTSLPDVVRTVSQVMSDQDAVTMVTLMTSLAKKWLDEDNTPPVVIQPPTPTGVTGSTGDTGVTGSTGDTGTAGATGV